MVCGNCGKKIGKGFDYCPKCGTKLNQDDQHGAAKKGHSNKGIIIAIIVAAAMITGGIVLGILINTYLLREDNKPAKKDIQTRETTDGEDDPSLPEEIDVKKGDFLKLGSYEQDKDSSNGKEPIEWEVLDVDGDRALLISKYVLDVIPYNDVLTNVTWETCSLRTWLNNDFYAEAFSTKEKDRILTTHLVNDNNDYWKTNGGNDTDDKVFCLGLQDVFKYYHYEEEDGLRLAISPQLVVEGTDYANSKGLENFTVEMLVLSAVAAPEDGSEVEYEDPYGKEYLESIGYSLDTIGNTGTWWWLRTPGWMQNGTDDYIDSSYACVVGEGSGLYGVAAGNTTAPGNADRIGIRPAVWITVK